MNSIVKQLLLLLSLLPVTGFVTNPTRSVTIQFKHKMGSRELQLFSEGYANPFGEPVIITRFKYYISHLTITGADQKETPLSDKTFLIDESEPASKTLVFTTPVTAPQSLSFVMGGDSILNVSGVQTGSLDPLNGMFWTWNSGYIFARLEGKSDSSHAPAHLVNWDVGGFKAPFNASRKITLDIANATGTVITIEADLLKWFQATHAIHIAQAPLCHQPGRLAMQLADNYSHMFSIAP
jgi:hypothetical protein